MGVDISVFPLDQSPGFLIHRLDTLLSAGLHRALLAEGFDLTAEQWGVLSRLWEVEGLCQADLATRTAKDRHNMTRILHLLEKNGYILREPDPNDRRCSIVFLTDLGRGLQEKLTPLVLEFLEKCFRGLAAEDLARLRTWHETIVANLESLPRD